MIEKQTEKRYFNPKIEFQSGSSYLNWVYIDELGKNCKIYLEIQKNKITKVPQ